MLARDIEQIRDTDALIEAQIRARMEAGRDDGEFRPDRNPPEQLGMIAGGALLAVSLFLLVMWASTRTGYEACATIVEAEARTACYEQVRRQELSPEPAKGARIPTGVLHAGDD